MRTIFLWVLYLGMANPCIAQWHDANWYIGQEANNYPPYPGIDRVRIAMLRFPIIPLYGIWSKKSE